MRQLLIILSFLLFSLILISCKIEKPKKIQIPKNVGDRKDEGYGVTTDSSDNIYVTGTTNGDLDGNTNQGREDIFLIKYNSSGTKQWTKQLGS